MDPIISIRGLSKRYRLGVIGRKTLADELRYHWLKLRGRDPVQHLARIDHAQAAAAHAQTGEAPRPNDFWALDDVSFDVQRGEVIGIVGRNGAGKSTLLKILSRITEPTAGEAILRGRFGSLLEVGTGFHPELTGRENIYLNGAILGMRKAEIDRKLDEIVAFAEIEAFIDTPVKRYSSGMYVRLAFAVAAHLEPEIMIVDEVLAVGDAEFQRRCLRRMGDAARSGCTVLFVSHNMSAIQSLCNRGIFLDGGRLAADGRIEDVVRLYLGHDALSCHVRRTPTRPGRFCITEMRLAENGRTASTFNRSSALELEIHCRASETIHGAQVAFELWTETQQCLFTSTQQDDTGEKPSIAAGSHVFRCNVPLKDFRAGRYFIRVSSTVPNREVLDSVEEPLCFEVLDDNSPLLKLGQNRKGLFLPILDWRQSSSSPS